MTIEPDTKDWTWVLERPCPDCQFDAAALDLRSVGRELRSTAAAWSDVLRRNDVGVRVRADRWSALEYGCHVRDVCRIFDERLVLMLNEDGPRFANWEPDVTATEDRYHEQDPADVERELLRWASTLADRFDGVNGDQWQRTGFRSDGASFTIETFARYFLHDPLHHLWDVGAAAGGNP